MSSLDEITASLGKAFSAKLQGFKFVKSQAHLINQSDEGWQAILIRAIRTSDPGVKLSAHAHIRIDTIQNLYLPYIPYLTPKDAKWHPTLVRNCDLLLANKSLANNFLTDPRSIETFVSAYVTELRNNVLPWLEKYSDEQRLFEGLIEEDPMKRITSDRLTSYPVLLAISVRRSDWQLFDRIADEFTSFCAQPGAQIDGALAASIIAGLRTAVSA